MRGAHLFFVRMKLVSLYPPYFLCESNKEVREMKKSILMLVALFSIAAMVLSACQPTATPVVQEPGAATAAPAGKLSVGIVLPTKDEPRWIQDETRFKELLTAAGYDVQILFSQGDSAKEKDNVESLISQGIQVLIICPQDGTAAAAAAEAARAAGVKVISYDRLIRDTDAVDYYVTFDSVAVGEAWGNYLVENATGTGNNLYLYAGAASDNNAFLFFEGAWNILQPKIADGTFVIKNSSEAVALQDKADADPRRDGQDHRPGDHRMEVRRGQEPGGSQPDLCQGGGQGHRVHCGPE